VSGGVISVQAVVDPEGCVFVNSAVDVVVGVAFCYCFYMAV